MNPGTRVTFKVLGKHVEGLVLEPAEHTRSDYRVVVVDGILWEVPVVLLKEVREQAA
jgi:hypothetical protein